jgi:hypothetical protein
MLEVSLVRFYRSGGMAWSARRCGRPSSGFRFYAYHYYYVISWQVLYPARDPQVGCERTKRSLFLSLAVVVRDPAQNSVRGNKAKSRLPGSGLPDSRRCLKVKGTRSHQSLASARLLPIWQPRGPWRQNDSSLASCFVLSFLSEFRNSLEGRGSVNCDMKARLMRPEPPKGDQSLTMRIPTNDMPVP